jgi:hypothetical protein
MIRSQAQVRDLVLALERLKRQVLITSMHKEEPISTEPVDVVDKSRTVYYREYKRKWRAERKTRHDSGIS